MRRMLAIVCTAATVLLAGCDSDDSTRPTQSSVAGTWNLTTVNGSALPYTLQPTPKIEILSERYDGHDRDHSRRRHVLAQRYVGHVHLQRREHGSRHHIGQYVDGGGAGPLARVPEAVSVLANGGGGHPVLDHGVTRRVRVRARYGRRLATLRR
jgi:hypothetical protein